MVEEVVEDEEEEEVLVAEEEEDEELEPRLDSFFGFLLRVWKVAESCDERQVSTVNLKYLRYQLPRV